MFIHKKKGGKKLLIALQCGEVLFKCDRFSQWMWNHETQRLLFSLCVLVSIFSCIFNVFSSASTTVETHGWNKDGWRHLQSVYKFVLFIFFPLQTVWGKVSKRLKVRDLCVLCPLRYTGTNLHCVIRWSTYFSDILVSDSTFAKSLQALMNIECSISFAFQLMNRCW